MSGAPEKLSAGQAFGRYQIVRMIGEGGMGAVYEAVHTGLKKRVAIKTLLPSIAQSPEAQARFLREGEAASRINHPNVVDVTDVGSELGLPYLVMEYLEGETIDAFVAREGPLSVAVAVDLLLPSLAAVASGHDSGVIHRDLKPQNVFLSRGHWGEPVPKILDFGVSKILGDQSAALTGTMALLGTACYMSPEQARGARVIDAASDQYAMGLIFYEMLTGMRAHAGESPLEVLHRIASGEKPNVRERRPDLPVDVETVLDRMLAMNPRDRFPSVRAVARALIHHATEKVRVNYEGAFREPEGVLAASLAVTPPPVVKRPGSAGSGGKSGGTRLLPSSGSGLQPPTTTLGQSATGSAYADLKPRRSPALLAIGGVALAAVVVGLVLTRGSTRTPAVNPEPVSAAPAAVELPQAPEAPKPAPPAVVAVPPAPAPAVKSTLPTPPKPESPSKVSAHAHDKASSSHKDPAHARPDKKPRAPGGSAPERGRNNSLILE
jgi:serine/threonine protein kinase